MATAAAAPSVAISSQYSGETKQDRAKGKDVRTSNIVACKAIASAIRTSLGPRGMDKMLQLADGSVIISNDGATILSKMKVLHPAAKMLVELSQSQDATAGDGTTTVVVLAGALLEACAMLLHKGIHPTVIAASCLQAADAACTALQSVAKPVDLRNRQALLDAVETCLSSKVVSAHSDILAPMAVDAVLGLLDLVDEGEGGGGDDEATRLKRNVDLRDIRVVRQLGGTVEDSELIPAGFVLDKGATKSAGGPTRMTKAKIALIQYCLSAPKTDMDNNVVVQDYASMDRILREERKYILNLCKQIKKSGCNVLLIQKSILRDAYNELSLHFLAKMDILVVTDIERTDVEFLCRTLHCQPVAHSEQMTADKLGSADLVSDVFVEGAAHRVVKFTGLPVPPANSTYANSKTATVLLRGSNELVLDEAARSLHDALCVVRCLVQERYLMAGGGAAEMQASVHLAALARQGGQNAFVGKHAYCVQEFASALDVIPLTLAENAGMKPVEVVTTLRAKHASGLVHAGIHVKTNQVVDDMTALGIVQPLLVSTSAFRLAAETVAMIMKIDDLIVVM